MIANLFKTEVFLIISLINFNIITTQLPFGVSPLCCPGYQIPWQYNYVYQQDFNSGYNPYWPYVRYPVHYSYFRPPLSYNYYNPCPHYESYCYTVSNIYNCCVDQCGQVRCEIIYDCDVEYSGDGPDDEYVDVGKEDVSRKCVDNIFNKEIFRSRKDDVDFVVDGYVSDFVFDE